MVTATLMDLNHFCYYEIFKQVKKNCERAGTPDEIKYVDLVHFIVCCQPFRKLFYEWDKDFYRSFFLLYLSAADSPAIDFSELYERLKGLPAKAKNAYWKSVCLAIEENDNLTDVELRYTPESHHGEHMEVFASVMHQLGRKKSLKALRVHISEYTIEDLAGFGNLEKLVLNARVDADELCRCCYNNRKLRVLSVLNSEMAGRRLADIAPFCDQVVRFDFKMKFDCDASEYARIAEMPRLEQLRIEGEHEPGTLQHLLTALARKESKLLRKLAIDEALLSREETTALSQIKLVNDLRCGFKDAQSIEPISKMVYLNSLEVLSEHRFSGISQQIRGVLKESQWKRRVLLKDCLMHFDPKGHLRLVLNQASAADYRSLLTLPRLRCLEILGDHEQGSLVELFKALESVKLPSLTINTTNPFTEEHRKLLKRGWRLRPQVVPTINIEEVEALSNCGNLKEIVCGFSDTKNIHLLANLLALEELTITKRPAKGSLLALFAALAAREAPSLQRFRLLNGAIDSSEAAELARIASLRVVQCALLEALDIGKFSDLAKENLKALEITSAQNFHETAPGILKVLQSSQNNVRISTKDVMLQTKRKLKSMVLQMSIFETYEDETLLVPLASAEWLEHLTITHKQGNLKAFFNALAKSNRHIREIKVEGGSLDVHETLELSQIKSLRKFRGKLEDPRSIRHLGHLSHIAVGDSFSNHLPEDMCDIFECTQVELTISDQRREIGFNRRTGRLTLCNAFSFDSEDIAPLASLRNLRSVRVLGASKRSLQYFISKLASRPMQSLQELIMETHGDEAKSSLLELSPVELKEVTAIRSLRTLKCGLSDPKDLELLFGLPELSHITIDLGQESALRSLLRKRSLGAYKAPGHLPVECTTACEIGPQNIAIKEMIILNAPGRAPLVDFFRVLHLAGDSTLQRLVVKGAPIVQCEAEELSRIQSLQRLVYRFQRLDDIRGLVRLCELTTLIIGRRNFAPENEMARIPEHIDRDLTSSYFENLRGVAQHLDRQRLFIELPPDECSVKSIFGPLPAGSTHTLAELVITHRYLGVGEFERITQVASLKTLRCGIREAPSFSLIRNLGNLECLAIKTYSKLADISDHLVLCFRACPKMQSIGLHFNGRVQLISADFVKRSIEALKSVRDPTLRGPLELSCFVSLVFVEPCYRRRVFASVHQ
ncbi:uncharacterized protein LOC108031114 isoform X2 [Drosophila biarmipes]|uniref:uncharacterized protein LOC108031114 isoform X2 n=1 Tax=Drosophila biarmipes TaxID=125945 RepID=UPI0021CCD28F|nr:uncharacterized protein LOC108031114 isoform X2 [Drosophila biarmipes]